MIIHFPCPACKSLLHARSVHIGRHATCTNCSGVVKIPARSGVVFGSKQPVRPKNPLSEPPLPRYAKFCPRCGQELGSRTVLNLRTFLFWLGGLFIGAFLTHSWF